MNSIQNSFGEKKKEEKNTPTPHHLGPLIANTPKQATHWNEAMTSSSNGMEIAWSILITFPILFPHQKMFT